MTFCRIQADGFPVNHDSLIGSYGTANGSHCVIQCSGSSAVQDDLTGANAVTMGINHAHTVDGIHPYIWTSYDWPLRFDHSLFENPSVLKLIPKIRSHELATLSLQAHELPNVVFFEQAHKSYQDFFGTGPIVDAEDSMLQAIDLAIRLGFKNIYLSGADLYVKLSPQQEYWFLNNAPDFKVCDTLNSLWETLTGIAKKNITGSDEGIPTPEQMDQINVVIQDYIRTLEEMPSEDLYSFGSANTSLLQRLQADHHYRIASSRLTKARKCLDRLGVKLSLLKPSGANLCDCRSRLDGWFPTCTVDDLPKIGQPTPPDYTVRGMTVRNDPPHREIGVKNAG